MAHEAADFEADAIIKCAKSSWATVEGELDKVDGVESSLLRVRNKVCENQKAQVKEPSFLAVITGMGEAAYRRGDGVYVIPIRALGA